MAIMDTIQDKVKLLSEPTQREVLEFVDYLLYKSRQEDMLWSRLSLTSALRGLEDEDWPDYSAQDLKERWS